MLVWKEFMLLVWQGSGSTLSCVTRAITVVVRVQHGLAPAPYTSARGWAVFGLEKS